MDFANEYKKSYLKNTLFQLTQQLTLNEKNMWIRNWMGLNFKD